MEFETLKQSHLKRNIIIGVIAVLIISAIVLNFTRAKYRVTQSIPLVNGTINYSLADLNIVALYIDGVEATELDSSTTYTLDTTNSTCTYKDGTAIDNLTLSYDSSTKTFTIAPYTTKGTKCTLYFDEYQPLLIEVVEEAYANNTTTLAYDGTVDNNLRYIGVDPANYVYFNCNDYSNPTSDTCELWRIIGVFNDNTHGISGQNLVKLIRSESLGRMAWDSGNENDWSIASLQETLNGDYLDRTGSYSSTGITTATRDMIENATWKLGGQQNTSNAVDFYTYERGTWVYSGNPTEWKGKIALIYPSDYGYATSGGSTGRETCLSLNLYVWPYYDDCSDNDWLSTVTEWTLNAFSVSANHVSILNSYSDAKLASETFSVRPSVYLTSEVKVSSGDGTSNSPYTLEV